MIETTRIRRGVEGEASALRQRELFSQADHLRRCAPALRRTVYRYGIDGYLADVLPVTDALAGTLLEMWAEQDAVIFAATGMREGWLVDHPNGEMFRLF